LANKIIQQNVNQFKKTLSSIKGPGQTPALVQTKDIYQQAHFITQKVLELSREGIPLKEMAVLVRSHFQSLEIEVELLKRNIPYIVRGGVKFFEQAHIKDIMAYLKIAVNPRDEISFKRAAGLHKNIGRSYAYKIWGKINEQQNARQIEEELPKRQREGFKEFIHVYETLKDKNAETAIRSILPFYKDYCFLNFDNPDERMLDIEELAKMAASYPTIKRFIAEMNSYEEFKSETLVAPAQKDEALVLSTIHQSKGLEWDSVFIVGLSEHEFPHPKSVGSNKGIEEERRLFYVAVTRAKSRVYMVYPQSKYTFKNGLILSKPSMFIEELDESGYESWHLEK
jgi:DNA helicase-2/ATP-dependent DNA helicase PcrA